MSILLIYQILVNFEVLLLRRCFYCFLRIQLIWRCFYSRGAVARQTGQSVKGALMQSVLQFRRGEYAHFRPLPLLPRVLLSETGYLIPLVETVGVNQQGKRAIALAPCFLAPTVSTRGIKYPCFILTRYLMHCLTNQRQVKESLLKTLSKCSC